MSEKMNAFEMSKKYYPRLWSLERIEALYKAEKLTKDEYDSIINSKKQ